MKGESWLDRLPVIVISADDWWREREEGLRIGS